MFKRKFFGHHQCEGGENGQIKHPTKEDNNELCVRNISGIACDCMCRNNCHDIQRKIKAKRQHWWWQWRCSSCQHNLHCANEKRDNSKGLFQHRIAI